MAVSEIEKNRRRWEENPKGLAFAAYADALRKAGEAEQALEVLQAGLEYHPDYIPANIVRGRCHLDLGEDAAAEAAFGRVLALDPENVIALKALADVTERGQRWGEATQWLQALLGIDRGNDAAREQMARIQIAQHDADIAAAQAVTDAEQAAIADAAAAEAAEADAVTSAAAGPAALVAETAAEEAPMQLEQSQPDAWVPDAVPVAEDLLVTVTEDAGTVAPLEGLESTGFQSDDAPATVLESFVTEEVAESTLLLNSSAAAGEFAVEDAADGFRSAAPEGRVVPADAAVSTPSWADVGKGEYVPALFADADQPPAPDAPAAPVTPLDGLVLERSSDEPLVSAVADEEPVADVVAHAGLATADDAPDAISFSSEPAREVEVVGEVLVDAAGESLVLPDLESGADEAVPPAPVEDVEAAAFSALADAAVPGDAATTAADEAAQLVETAVTEATIAAEPAAVGDEATSVTAAAVAAGPAEEERVPAVTVCVPGIVQALALAPHEVEAADRAARELIEAELAASHERPLRDVLAEAPAADPAVLAMLAEPEPTAASLNAEPTVVRLSAAEADDVAVVVPTAPAPIAAFIADEPEDESAAVPPGFSTPMLVTAAMATLYAQQGHLHEALATYRSLDAREPGRHAAAIADLEARVAAALPARPVFAARASGGQPVRDFFQSLVRAVPPALVEAVAPGAGNGPSLRKADDAVSLGRLFGEEPAAGGAVPLGVAARAPSFDEFYGAASTAKEQGGRDDIEQFHAWLQGLKS